jgi:hypothetical protein
LVFQSSILIVLERIMIKKRIPKKTQGHFSTAVCLGIGILAARSLSDFSVPTRNIW